MNRIILHLDADAFFASVEQGYNPALQNKPVIVGGLPDRRGCVHTASYDARRMGVYTGMSLRKAKETCPEAVFLKGDYRRYRAAGSVMEEILCGFSPDVEMASIDDAYVDLTHVMRHYESAVHVAERIKREIRSRLNIGISIGIGTSKLIAGIASGLNKPEGITAVPPGQEQQFLSMLPLRKLRGIGRKTEVVFHELGITTVGGLAALPKTTVLQLLGAIVGEAIWQYAHGRDSRQVLTRVMPKQISRETSFEEDTDDAKLIKGTLRYLSERIAAKLRKNNWTARRVHVKVYYADGKSGKQSETLSCRTGDGGVIYSRVFRMYQGFQRRRVRVRLVGVTAHDIAGADEQRSLFTAVERRDGLNKGVDRVRERFGFTSVAAGSTLILQNYYRMEKHGYILHTPSLSQ